ncbi:class I SAM-dependent methyltransferase [Clostridium magnum]|uniref:Ribosomal protein L11 methyltransferase n=1 Tax=Clostridium magnum DSM 2767 TaxID=1121326 RepID=A0A161YPF7_9CLOT|nr:class I SAM-dependent methyltransferase [Clostridium magnum]KZL92682.1 ribosomal protein L11 methyltransferase [Clostridium magnum DSM 2767]SHI24451.1 Methyltransferase domain-containing protein [Clostridium magnum DSM 2767]
MDMKYFSDLWRNSTKYYSVEEKFWNERAEEFNRRDIEEKENRDFFSILDFIEVEQDAKFKNVLDIGCGTGFYSIQFSGIADYVAGTDISKNMLEYAEKNAEAKNRGNITFVKKPWSELNLKEFQWKEKFDLVFASMTPAVDSYEDLMKMIACGTNLYFLSGFVERKDSLKDELSEIILDSHSNNPHGNKIYNAFNILWNMGYYPKISYKDSNWERYKSVDKFYQEFVIHFERKKLLTREDKAAIKNYLENKAVNGMVQEKITSKVAWLFWKK